MARLCFVFDLDGLLWDPEMYQLYGGAPFSVTSNPHELRDCRGEAVRLLGELSVVVQCVSRWVRCPLSHIAAGIQTHRACAKQSAIQARGDLLAVASSTDEPAWARECLAKFTVNGSPLVSYFRPDLVVIEKVRFLHAYLESDIQG